MPKSKAPDSKKESPNNSEDLTSISNSEFERIGRSMVNIAQTGYINRRRLYWLSFVKGIFSGVGGVIGATIVIALLLWVLSWMSEVPLIGDFAERVQDTIQNSTNR